MKKLLLLCVFSIYILTAAIPPGYYNSAEGKSGEDLKAALHEIIDGHKTYSYSNLWDTLVETDEDPNNSSNFILIYTGRSLPKTASFPQWNREHSWPKSHGDFGNTAPAGTDMHHLRPSDVSVNSARGNKDYDDGGSLVSGTTDCYMTGDSFEPRDEVKGDCARMMFYMATRYDGGGEPDLELVDYTGTSGPRLGKLSTLIEWHTNDPVDDFERRRNDVVYSYQENRNPFIDHPEYVYSIWGGEGPSSIAAPLALDASNIDSTSFTCNWQSVSAASGYKLYLATDISFSGTLPGYNPKDLTTLSESVSGLNPETNYYYKLKSYNSEYESEFSNVISVLTLAGLIDTIVTPPDTISVTGTETFENFPETGSSYMDGTFLGQDGSTWTYISCRGDQEINGETPCLAKGKVPDASVYSGTISGGIGVLSFDYKQAFSTDVSLDVYINDDLKATVTTNNEQFIIKNSGNISVNIEGDFVIKFLQSGKEAGQVAIDNVVWSSYEVGIKTFLPKKFSVGEAYPNPFNPSCTLPLTLEQGSDIYLGLHDLLGREVKNIYQGHLNAGEHTIHIDGRDLPTGIYLIRVDHSSGRKMRKVLLLK